MHSRLCNGVTPTRPPGSLRLPSPQSTQRRSCLRKPGASLDVLALSIRYPILIKAVEEEIEASPRKNVRRLAKIHNITKSTMGDLTTPDLGVISGAVDHTQSLTALHRKKTVARSKEILNWMKKLHWRSHCFHEKNWYIDIRVNRRSIPHLANGIGPSATARSPSYRRRPNVFLPGVQ